MLRGARGLHAEPEPVQVEAFASSVLSIVPRNLIDVDDPELFFGKRLVEYLIGRRTDDALALLHGVAAITRSEALARLAHAGALRLRVAGRKDPRWADAIGRARFVDAFAPIDPYEEQDLVVSTFAYPDGRRHALVFLVDQNFDGLIRQAHIAADPGEVRHEMAVSHGFALRPVAAQEVANRLAHGLQVFDESLDPPSDQEVVGLLPLLRERQRALPAPVAMEQRPFSDLERDALLAEFARSREAGRKKAITELAPLFVACRLERVDADPLRWSPIAVELCLVDWLPRKVVLDEDDIRAAPDALKRWIRFAGRKKGLAPALVDETLAAVDQFAPEFDAAARQPSSRGPAGAIVQAMLGDGVDISDEQAVGRWIGAFNARPIEERDAVLGWSSRAETPAPSIRLTDRDGEQARRAFAFPPLVGRFGAIDLALLDPADQDDRATLIEAEHPEFTRALAQYKDLQVGGQTVNPRLHLAMHEIVASQLWDNQPPEAWSAAQRLTSRGMDRHDVFHHLMRAVSDIVYGALRDPLRDQSAELREALDALGRGGRRGRSS